jgi:hypothetical protein
MEADGSALAFISTSRDHKEALLRVADASTGAVRTVMSEKVATQYESRAGCQVLWDTGEVIWFSERDDWGHVYLYDLASGTLKGRITSGDGPVMQIIRLDGKSRTVWFQAQGREKGEDPYFRHAYRIALDGRGLVALTPVAGDHSVQISPSGRYLVDTWSQPDQEPSVALRDGDGKFVMMLERADVSRLRATGWQPPLPITMKARDGKTDIYGLMFRPSTFDPSRKYPVVNNVYPGPQTGSTGSRSFAAARGDRQALAELGFIVVTIDGMGTPGRSKSFQDAYYGAMGRDNTIPDQITGMKELAQKYPWFDIERAGIWGHSGGGFATTTAMFRFPDFFKAGSAESGNHDQRLNEDDWGERYQGLLTRGADGSDNYAAEASRTSRRTSGPPDARARDDGRNVPPCPTMLVADALIGEQGLRSRDAAQPGSRLRPGGGLHDAAALGLLREVADGRRAAEGVPDAVARPAGAGTCARGDEGRHPPRRLRSLSRQQRPAVLQPRHPGRSREEVHQRQQHHPLQDAEGRHADPVGPGGKPRRGQDPLRREGAQIRAGVRGGVR